MQIVCKKIGRFHFLARFCQVQQIRGSHRNHYEVLGVDRSATNKVIRQRFLELSKQLHPDISKQENTHEQFVKINEAYTILSNPLSRKEYDVSLAARLIQHQQMRSSSAYGSHNFGSAPHPGDGFESGGEAKQAFWDETLYHMRNRSKDKEYEGRPYYGVRGVNRLPNSYIVIACCIWIAGGALLHFFAIKKSSKMHQSALDKRDMENHALYVQSKESARVHGTAMQLQILKARIAERHKPKPVSSPTSADDQN